MNTLLPGPALKSLAASGSLGLSYSYKLLLQGSKIGNTVVAVGSCKAADWLHFSSASRKDGFEIRIRLSLNLRRTERLHRDVHHFGDSRVACTVCTMAVFTLGCI